MSIQNADYLLLFRGTNWDKGLSPQQIQEVMGRVMEWFDSLQRQGKVKGGHPLGDEGRTICGKNGSTVSDGPFVETKESIGGYILLQAADMDEVVAIAKTWPCLAFEGSVEVRPVAEECLAFQRAKDQLTSTAA